MPASHWKNRSIAVLAFVGFAVASYLTLAYMEKLPLVCDIPLFDCQAVAKDRLSNGFGIQLLSGIPTAAFGVLCFAAIAGLSILRAIEGHPVFSRIVAATQFGVIMLALLMVARLSYAEAFTIHAWCFWCLITALIVLVMAVIQITERIRPRQQAPDQPYRWHIREAAGMAGLDIVGITLGILLLYYVHHYLMAPHIAPNLTKAKLQLASCHVIGEAQAPYTLVQFGHYSCTHCKASVAAVNELLRESHGKLNFIFSPATGEDTARFYQLASAVEAAARQGKYREMHFALFEQQEDLNPPIHDPETVQELQACQERLRGLARKLGMNVVLFTQDLTNTTIHRTIVQRVQVAKAYHLIPPPKFVFFSPEHPPVVLPDTKEMVKWLHDPRHWR